MFGKNQSSLSSSIIIPAIVLFGLLVSVFVAIILFSSSRHIAATLPVPKNGVLAGADVSKNYEEALIRLSATVADSKDSGAEIIKSVQDVLLTVRVPASGLDKHLHAVVAIGKLEKKVQTVSAKEIQTEILAILQALIH